MPATITPMPFPIVIGVTGHRDLCPVDMPSLAAKVQDIVSDLRKRYPNSPLRILTSLAAGADTLAAQVGVSMGVALDVILPMPIEEYEKDFTSDESINALHELLGNANSVETIAKAGVDPSTKSGRILCYAEASVGVVDRSQILLALWDGVEIGGVSGTAQIVAYRQTGRKGWVEGDTSVYQRPIRGLICHLRTPRESNPKIRNPLAVDWTAHGNPGQVASLFQGLDLQDDLNSRLQGEAVDSINSSVPAEIPGIADLWQRFMAVDRLAVRAQARYQRSLATIFVLAFTAFAAFDIYAHLAMENFVVLLLFQLILGAAAIQLGISKSRQEQNRYLDYRALAEGLRVLIFWRCAGLSDSVADNYLAKQAGELEWIRWVIRANPVTPTPNEKLLEIFPAIRRYWLVDQGNYFYSAARRLHLLEHRMEVLAGVFFAIGLGLSLALLGYHLIHVHSIPLHHGLIVSVGIAIAASAFAHAYCEKAAHGELAKQFARMLETFQLGLEDCDEASNCGDNSKLKLHLKRLGIESLQENGDWVLLHRARPLELPKG